MIPYEGRYDAQPLAVMEIGNNKVIQGIAQTELQKIKGQVRDIKVLRSGDKQLIVVARNNEPLLYLTLME